MANTFKMVRSTVSSMISGIVKSVFSVVSLFKDGQQGFWYDPTEIDTLYQDSNGTTPVTLAGEPVGLVIDKSGNTNNGAQSISASRPTYQTAPERLTLDKVDDSFEVNIPTGGWIGSMVLATDQGTASYNVDIPAGNYEIGGLYFPGNSINNVLMREGVISASDLAQTEATFVSAGAKSSYGDVVNFSIYWRDMSELTSFPLIDTSSGTSFYQTWYGCNSLTSFPLIDTSSVNSFSQSWFGCNSLTSFPLLDTSSGTVFTNTWTHCTSLTSFPLLDTSSGTNFYAAWYNCASLTSFPLLDTSGGTNFQSAWYYCNSLTSFPLLDTSSSTSFNGAWRSCTSLTNFPLLDTSSGTNFSSTWRSCTSLTSFPLINTSSGTGFSYTWTHCTSLTSFPLIDTSSGTNFNQTWRNCTNLTSFPLIDTSSGTNFSNTWYNCNSLTSFPLLDTSSSTNFYATWRSCNSLTSFPLLDISSGTNFSSTWRSCTSLTSFPVNFFDSCVATNFAEAFTNTNLSQQSIDGILVSIDSNATSNGTFNQSGGSAPSATGEAAITAMRSRGWTVTVTGGF